MMHDNRFFLIPPHFHMCTQGASTSSHENTKRCAATPFALWFMKSSHFIFPDFRFQISTKHWISRIRDPSICLDVSYVQHHVVRKTRWRLQTKTDFTKTSSVSRTNSLLLLGFTKWSIGIGYNSNEREKTAGSSGLIKPASPAHG